MNKLQKIAIPLLFVVGFFGFFRNEWNAVGVVIGQGTVTELFQNTIIPLDPNAFFKLRMWSLLEVVVGVFGWVSLIFLWKNHELPFKIIQRWIIVGVVCLLLMYFFHPFWMISSYDFYTIILCFWLLIKIARNKSNLPISAS